MVRIRFKFFFFSRVEYGSGFLNLDFDSITTFYVVHVRLLFSSVSGPVNLNLAPKLFKNVVCSTFLCIVVYIDSAAL